MRGFVRLFVVGGVDVGSLLIRLVIRTCRLLIGVGLLVGVVLRLVGVFVGVVILFGAPLTLWNGLDEGLVPVFCVQIIEHDLHHLVDGKYFGGHHFEVSPDGQPGVRDALLVGLVQSQVLVPVVVHDAPDDVHLVLAQLGDLVGGVGGQVHELVLGVRKMLDVVLARCVHLPVLRTRDGVVKLAHGPIEAGEHEAAWFRRTVVGRVAVHELRHERLALLLQHKVVELQVDHQLLPVLKRQLLPLLFGGRIRFARVDRHFPLRNPRLL
mmetsp:Transcript_4959/g.8597  ORF Transcript_4959/g.8597 Transcript_4959/m.8597 type:complete len:267 (-) Transcript_4959:480-1280(-)